MQADWSCSVEKQLVEPDATTDERKCAEALAELANLGLANPPAVILHGDDGKFIWGMPGIKRVNEVSVHDIAEKIPRGSEVRQSHSGQGS